MTVTRFQTSLPSTPAALSTDSLPASRIAPASDVDLLAVLGQASFVWDIAGDALQWSDNAADVLRDILPSALTKATEFSKLIEPARGIRNDAVLNSAVTDSGQGVPYQIEYGLRAGISAPVLWIDECGRWFAGADGKPSHAHGIVRVNNERHARNEQLLKLSQDDPLTGEFNRTRLMGALAETFEEASRFRSSFAFMLVGIDQLAQINDAFGYDIADEVIVEVARRIRARLRGGDVLGRFSGNKFGLILKNCSVDDMNVAAERFLSGIRDDVVPTRSGPVALTASIGAINALRHARTVEEAMSRTQEALDLAKVRRRGSLMVWRPNVERDALPMKSSPRSTNAAS